MSALLGSIALLLIGGMGSLVAAVWPTRSQRAGDLLFWSGVWSIAAAFVAAFAGVFV